MAQLKEIRARADWQQTLPLSGDGGGDAAGDSLLGWREERKMRLQGSLGPSDFCVWTGSPICAPGWGLGAGTLLGR